MKSRADELIHKDKLYVWHPFTQMGDWEDGSNLVIEAGRGSRLKDSQGNWYLDGISSLWVNVHGHRKKEIDQAIQKQVKKLAHSTLLGLSSEPSIRLAEKLIRIAPKGLKKVFYSDSGSTAVEIALKMATQYWQQKGNGLYKKKKRFVHLDNAYHGDTLGSVSVGGIDLFHEVYSSLIFKTFESPSPHCYRCSLTKQPSNSPKLKSSGNLARKNPVSQKICSWECFKGLENLLRQKGDEIPTMNPAWRTSPTHSKSSICFNLTSINFIFGPNFLSVFSFSNRSKLAIAAAQAKEFPV